MARSLEMESELVSDSVVLKWEIKNFSEETIWIKNFVMQSPTFNCFSADLHLKMSLNLEMETIRLQLVQNNPDNPLRILNCDIGFINSEADNDFLHEQFSAPIESPDNIFCVFRVHKLLEEYAKYDVLTVRCNLEAIKLNHNTYAQSKTHETGNEKIPFRHGYETLAKSIGNMLEDCHLSDVTLKVGEEMFRGHKSILASRSKVFHGMFQSGMKESQGSVVDIMTMKPTIFKKILHYIYNGTMAELSMEQTIDVYVAADRYDLQELKRWAKEYIVENISPDYVCKVQEVANLHSDEELANASERVFKGNWKITLESEAWKDFEKENPTLQLNLLKNTLLNVG